MNQQTISDLYKSGRFGSLMTGEPCPVVRRLVVRQRLAALLHAAKQLELSAEQDARYEVSASDSRGLPILHTHTDHRLYTWIADQLPEQQGMYVGERRPLTSDERCTISAWKYQDVDGRLSGLVRYGARADLAVVLRGIAAHRRKREKQLTKAVALLYTHHEHQEMLRRMDDYRDLRKGIWLGADKAITTAARTPEPGLPFMADYLASAGLTPEQERGLRYWAVKPDSKMEAAFPTGTGLAIRQIHHVRELVEGAVYLYVLDFDGRDTTMIMGRAQLAARTRRRLVLKCDDATEAYVLPLEWKSERVKVYRVLAYTTHATEVLPPARMVSLPVQAMEQEPLKLEPLELAIAA